MFVSDCRFVQLLETPSLGAYFGSVGDENHDKKTCTRVVKVAPFCL